MSDSWNKTSGISFKSYVIYIILALLSTSTVYLYLENQDLQQEINADEVRLIQLMRDKQEYAETIRSLQTQLLLKQLNQSIVQTSEFYINNRDVYIRNNPNPVYLHDLNKYTFTSMAILNSSLILENCNYIIISALQIRNNQSFGLKIVNCSSIVLPSNLIETNGTGIIVKNSRYLTLGSPPIYGFKNGVYTIIHATSHIIGRAPAIQIDIADHITVQGFNATNIEDNKSLLIGG